MHFAQICFYYASILLIAFAFLLYANNFAGKIDASLDLILHNTNLYWYQDTQLYICHTPRNMCSTQMYVPLQKIILFAALCVDVGHKRILNICAQV